MSTATAEPKTPQRLLQDARRAAGLSREALGAAAGVTGSTIYRMEADGVIPKPHTLARIIRALNVDPTEVHRALLDAPR